MRIGLLIIAFSLVSSISFSMTPKEHIEKTINRVLEILKTRGDAEEDSRRKKTQEDIKSILAEAFSYSEMARRTINKSDWNGLSDAQKEEFTNLFKTLLEETYISKLVGYSNEEVVFGEEKIKKQKARVATEIKTIKNKIPIEYRLVNTGEKWMVYDIRVEDISLIGNYRSQFTTIMDQKKYSGLKARLEARIEEIKKEAETPKS